MLLPFGHHTPLPPADDDRPARHLFAQAKLALVLVAAVIVVAVGLTRLAVAIERRHVTFSSPGWERVEEFDVMPSASDVPVSTVANETTAIYPTTRFIEDDAGIDASGTRNGVVVVDRSTGDTVWVDFGVAVYDSDFGRADGSASVGPAGFVLEYVWADAARPGAPDRMVVTSPDGLEWRQLRPAESTSLIVPGGDAIYEIGDTAVRQLDGDQRDWAAPWASNGTPVRAGWVDDALAVITQSSGGRAEASVLRDGAWATAELPDEFGDALGWLGPWALATAKATLPVVDGSLVFVATTWFDGPNMWISANGLDWSPAAELAALADPNDFPTVTYVDPERIIIRFRVPDPAKHTCWFTSTPCQDIGAQRLEHSAEGLALLSAPRTGYDDTQLIGLTNDGHLITLARLDYYSRNVEQRPVETQLLRSDEPFELRKVEDLFDLDGVDAVLYFCAVGDQRVGVTVDVDADTGEISDDDSTLIPTQRPDALPEPLSVSDRGGLYWAQRVEPDRIEITRFPDGVIVGTYDASSVPFDCDCH